MRNAWFEHLEYGIVVVVGAKRLHQDGGSDDLKDLHHVALYLVELFRTATLMELEHVVLAPVEAYKFEAVLLLSPPNVQL